MKPYSSGKKPPVYYIFLFFLGGIILRGAGLASQSVWIDEFCTAKFAGRDSVFFVFWEIYARDMHPPTWYLLNHFMGKLFGFSELTIRILPFIFSIVCMAVFYRLTRVFFSEKISLAAFFLFAFNPYQIYYAQEARMYTMFLMTSLFIMYYFLMSLKYNTFLKGAFTFWAVAGIYTHSYTVFIILILNGVLFLKYREEIRIKEWMKSMAVILLSALPLFPLFLKGAAGDQYSHNVGMLFAPVYTLKNFIFGITMPFNWISLTALIGVLYFIMLGIFTYGKNIRKAVNVTAITAGVFMFFPWIISILNKPVYSDRTFILVSAIVILLLGAGISYLSKPAAAGVLLIISCFYAVSLYNYYFNPEYQKTDYAVQFEFIKDNFKEGDIIVHSHVNSYAAYEFYNSLKYKTEFENRLLNEIPEFRGSGMRMKIREIWRTFREKILNEKLNLDIYAGYDRNTLPGPEAEKIMKNYDRVWFVRDNKKGIKQVWLPLGNVWNSSYEEIGLPEPVDIKTIKWVKKYFKTAEEYGYLGNKVYLLERK
ncbi:MAG: glycosyltransferase family 39 protein [Candidatus Goldiibacteriota bacterium]